MITPAPQPQSERKFLLGQIVATPNALEKLLAEEIQQGLSRHLIGDWGDCESDDKEANDLALQDGTRLFSVYHSAAGIKFWIITEADRSSTTILLPEDY